MSPTSLRALRTTANVIRQRTVAGASQRNSSTYTTADEAALDSWAAQLLSTRARVYTSELSPDTLADLFCTLPSRCHLTSSDINNMNKNNMPDTFDISDAAALQYRAPLRPLHTLAFFHPRATEDELARDRTAERELCPPLPFGARRMWAGGAYRFPVPLGPKGSAESLRVGDEAFARARVTRVQKKGMGVNSANGNGVHAGAGVSKVKTKTKTKTKASPAAGEGGATSTVRAGVSGNTGAGVARPMVFVHQEIEYVRAAEPERPLVEEERVHVYLPKAVRTDRRIWREVAGLPKPQFTFSWTPTPTTLFRFSAVTWNAHLIHLDPVYAREEDGHLERLVHGPLTALMLIEGLFHAGAGRCSAHLSHFSYRAQNPVLVGRTQHVRGAFASDGKSAVLWAEDDDGVVGMTGEVKLL